MPRPDRTTLLLIVAIALSIIAYVDYRGRDSGNGGPPINADQASGTSGQPSRTMSMQNGLHPLAGLRLGDLGDTVSRPLFEPSRRFHSVRAAVPMSAPVAPQPSVAEASTFRLIGTIVGEGRATAVVLGQGRHQAVRVEEGDSVDAWTVEKISRDQVIMVNGGRRQTLRMTRKSM